MTEISLLGKSWRCFHCDEVFTKVAEATLHFGMDQCQEPACKIKMGAEHSLLVALRRLEEDNEKVWRIVHEENSESAKAYYDQQTRHREQMQAAEELGFERGMKAFKKESNCTGVKDSNKQMIYLGDVVRYKLEGPHTKEEYWNPEYEVIWDAPSFTLKHVGGGKDGGSHDFILKHGGSNGDLLVIRKAEYV